MTETVNIKTRSEAQNYEIKIGAGLLDSCGEWARACLPAKTQKIAIVSNKKIFRLYGGRVKKALQKAGFKVQVFLMNDGENFKDTNSLFQLLHFLGGNKFTRSDGVVALGGGVAGDLAGFASAVYLRGIPFLQIPTTLLAQVDSSVGGKTAVNAEFGKNSIGAFYQPNGVLIDVETLKTLDPRDLTAGFCEAVKQGAVAGEKLFRQTKEFLEKYPPGKFNKSFSGKESDKFKNELGVLINAQVSFKAKIVAGDQKEDQNRTDSRSRKVLNFGHTIGHAIELATNYKQLKHGEAIGYGMLAAGEISKKLEILDANGLNLLSDVVRLAGYLPKVSPLIEKKIFQATAFDKKRAGKTMTWVLLKGIGKPVLVTGDEIPVSLIKDSIKTILK